ncbi:Putative velvet factor [Septoria linicola]|uniref:Velvet factor n=1 Tax=Septoria linicola TaxID=215465 RepID=A0A9Q9AYI3_9PEZI|nr:Putative velvet factor [Septoria linicola]
MQQHQQIPSQNPYPSSQPHYQSNGIHHDITTRGSSDHTNGHQSNGVDMQNPYQYGYGAPPPPPIQQQYAQPGQQQMRAPPMPNPYMQNQLPPLSSGPHMGAPMANMPIVTEAPSTHRPSSANSMQPVPYGMQAPPPPMQPPQQSSLPPQPARASTTLPNGEKKMSSTSEREGLRYSLQVVQQPQRARMCGFGDKDRRPITPPPCVRLVIVDTSTGKEVQPDDGMLGDPSFYILQVDLWAETADREANVVRASSNSPAVSISSATTTSYPPPAEPQRHYETHSQVLYVGQDGIPVYTQIPAYAAPNMARPGYPSGMFYGNMGQPIGYAPPPQQSSAMYTRNLIGSLTVNAARLNDNEGKQGFWFVLQDLSVRTEGFFRLRMSFIDISNRGAPGVNKGSAPVLAWTFSDKFQVYSAKKFPGVIESTPLSKCFAGQGIKIPIRKDNKNEGNDDEDGD